jgi:hypothetical protein
MIMDTIMAAEAEADMGQMETRAPKITLELQVRVTAPQTS